MFYDGLWCFGCIRGAVMGLVRQVLHGGMVCDEIDHSFSRSSVMLSQYM